MTQRTWISSSSQFPTPVSFSHAVRVGGQVFVSDTTPLKDGRLVGDARAQARQALENMLWALEQAGASANDVAR